MLLVLFLSLFVSSRCTLELKFAVYDRAAESLSSQAPLVGIYSMGSRITDLSICWSIQ